jgi:hypothetical protein
VPVGGREHGIFILLSFAALSGNIHASDAVWLPSDLVCLVDKAHGAVAVMDTNGGRSTALPVAQGIAEGRQGRWFFWLFWHGFYAAAGDQT